MARIGVFGGTFDPVHNGHLCLAQAALDHLRLQRVLFVPNARSPFKIEVEITSATHRWNMLTCATFDIPHFDISEVEILRGGISYTIETLRALQNELSGESLVLLTGSDALRDITHWREPEEVFRLAEVAAAIRPGVSESESLENLPESWRKRVYFVQMPALEISSTDIRQRVARGEPIRDLVPHRVADYIEQWNLFRTPTGETA